MTPLDPPSDGAPVEAAPRPQPPMGGRGMPPPGQRPSLRKAFEVFDNVYFRWIWASTLASFGGMQMQIVARGILAWELSGSYAVVGVVEASFALPMAFFSLPGGAAVDRVEKRQIVRTSQGVMGLLALATGLMIQTDVITIPLLFGVGVIQGTLFSVNGPARMALMTEIVGERQLTAAISLQNVAMNGTRIVAPAIAGLVVATLSIQAAYYVTAVFYVFTLVSFSQIPKTTSHLGRVRRHFGGEVMDGLRYVFGDHRLRSIMLSGFSLAFFVMPYNLMLAGFSDNLGHPDLYGPMLAISGVGGLVGSLTIASFTEHPRKPLLQLFVGLGTGVAMMGLGLLSMGFGVAGAFVALALLGGGATAYMTLNQTMLMSTASPEYHGRTMSIFMQTFAAMPLMALPLGAIADQIGADRLFVAQGVLVIVAIATLALSNPSHTFRDDSVRDAPGDRGPTEERGAAG